MIPAPLYRDPIYDGAADPTIIRKESDGRYYIFYTQRRASQNVECTSYGTAIGVAESFDGEEWHYLGALDLNFEFGHNTYWAPEVVYDPETKLYHMYVSYIRGIYTPWKGNATLEHYTSEDLFYWKHIKGFSFGSTRIIDPCIYKLPSGKWRMWYKDECQRSRTCCADSDDLYEWEYKGLATTDEAQEGPNVFEFGGKYWMVCDVWHGLAVYHSDDCEHFCRQEEIILGEGGTRSHDNVKGGHADVIRIGERAFIVYFTHPYTEPELRKRSSIQMAELTLENGVLKCDRNREFSICG
jgi:hypothetical protein